MTKYLIKLPTVSTKQETAEENLSSTFTRKLNNFKSAHSTLRLHLRNQLCELNDSRNFNRFLWFIFFLIITF